jgi:hypothetical protein
MKFKSHQFQILKDLCQKYIFPPKYHFQYRRKWSLNNSKQDCEVFPSKEKKIEIAVRILSGKPVEHITNVLLLVLTSMFLLQSSLLTR